MMAKITNAEFTKELCDALGLKNVRRIVIDAGYPGDAVKIYTESYASEKLLSITSKVGGIEVDVIDVSTNG